MQEAELVMETRTGAALEESTVTLRFHLSVFVQDVSKEAVGVGEALRARTLPHTDHSVLLSMQNTALEQETTRTSADSI